ncbi:MAG: HAMP domain-containing histidine kinase [Flavobacteriales bacterium]|nr:HAMP domain-containing histidine kinase [Flavobacteriales bacterium]MCB9447346.1 HAMP domain-containing histidine kinase [Flavobacteriales bacterium]
MKRHRPFLYITLSSLALVIVLIIQINWILGTAAIKEEIFNDKANMVLSRTAEALSSDQKVTENLQISVGQDEAQKIDSLLNHYMEEYNIHIDYHFEIQPGPMPMGTGWSLDNGAAGSGQFQACIGGPAGNGGMLLKLVFPDREQFILAEMGVPFISSVALILVVMLMSWRTILSLLREKQLSEQTTDFLNNMTHEFKTPLTNIALAGKMLTREGGPDQEEKRRHYTDIILEENEKLTLQVEQVLGMTALERGEIPLRKTRCDLHQLIREACQRMRLQIENKEGEVTLDLGAEHSIVMGDEMHLVHAIGNLIDNAIKYANEKPEVRIRTWNSNLSVILSVADKGVGIERVHQKKVFGKFFRVPTGDVHNVKGFGIGLSYVKKIIDLHHGTIHLESKKGAGTTFTITLPYV